MYKLSESELQEVHKGLLELLKVFKKICEEEGIWYTLAFGTVLGAVRHKGFIPWDDDIDLVMLRNDYNKLLSLPHDCFEEPFFLQTPETDPGYCRGIARLRNSNTTMIPYRDAAFDYNHGIFIDIFVLDAVIDNEPLRRRQERKMNRCLKLLHFSGRVNGGVGTLGLSVHKKLLYYVLFPLYKTGVFTSSKLFHRLNKLASMYEDTNYKYIGLPTFQLFNKRNTYLKEDFKKPVLLSFEGRQLPAPINYDRVLTTCFGDYMTPVKEDTQHGVTIIKTDIPYKEYVASNKDELNRLFLEWFLQ